MGGRSSNFVDDRLPTDTLVGYYAKGNAMVATVVPKPVNQKK